jgi:predicted lipoprotein with Yx(FWY)xxD motif
MQRLRTVSLAAVIAATGVVAAACGSGGSGYGEPASRPPTSAPPPTGTTTTVTVTGSPLGQLLVDGSGRTLYLFKADKSTISTCYDACADAWPPLLTTAAPSPGTNINAPDLATSARRDGTAQVTFHGHPLYRFVGDAKPGDTNGQGLSAFGARWYVVGADGSEITRA